MSRLHSSSCGYTRRTSTARRPGSRVLPYSLDTAASPKLPAEQRERWSWVNSGVGGLSVLKRFGLVGELDDHVADELLEGGSNL